MESDSIQWKRFPLGMERVSIGNGKGFHWEWKGFPLVEIIVFSRKKLNSIEEWKGFPLGMERFPLGMETVSIGKKYCVFPNGMALHAQWNGVPLLSQIRFAARNTVFSRMESISIGNGMALHS